MMGRSEALARLCRQFDIETLYVFGSRAREVQEWVSGQRPSLSSKSTDVDVGVKASRVLTANDKVRLSLALEDLLGVIRVDLLSLSEVDPFLAANIVRGARLYARDAYQADEYDLYVLRRAGDLAPLERERMALILGGSR